MWEIIISIILLIPYSIITFRIGKIFKNDKNIINSMFKKATDELSERSISTPETKMKFRKYFLFLFIIIFLFNILIIFVF